MWITCPYRQEQIFKTRHEVMIPRQNMVRWTDMVSDRLEPIYNILKDRVLTGDYIQMDETPIRYLDPGFRENPDRLHVGDHASWG